MSEKWNYERMENSNCIDILDKNDDCICTLYDVDYGDQENTEEYAKHIVHSHNTYDTLVEALEKIIKSTKIYAVEADGQHSKMIMGEALQEAEQALSLAKDGEQMKKKEILDYLIKNIKDSMLRDDATIKVIDKSEVDEITKDRLIKSINVSIAQKEDILVSAMRWKQELEDK